MTQEEIQPDKAGRWGPGWVAQLVRASSQYTKVAGSIPGQGTRKTQPMNASVHGAANRSISLSLFLKKNKK